MSLAFKEYLYFYKFSSSNNFVVSSDYIVYDELMPSFLGYPLTPANYNFRKFFRYSLKNRLLKNLLSLFHFKFQKLTQINFVKDDKEYQFISPYKERSRYISYPIDDDFDFFLTITYKNPFKNEDFDIFKIASLNDYINSVVKEGFRFMREYFRITYKRQLKREFKNMSSSTLEAFFGYVPTTDDLNKYINDATKKFMSSNYKYFRVYETHKSNVIHVHALVKFPKFFTDLPFQEMISKLANWFKTELNGIELDRITKSKKHKGSGSVKSYILKYMNKQFQNDNLFYVENEKKEKIYFLKTSAFLLNFIPRIISRSRNVSVKRYKPFYSCSVVPSSSSYGYKDVSLLDFDIEKKEYTEYKSILDDIGFTTMQKKRLNYDIEIQKKNGYAAYLLQEYLEDRYFSIEKIEKALDWLRFNDDYMALWYRANKKFSEFLTELYKSEKENDDWVDF